MLHIQTDFTPLCLNSADINKTKDGHSKIKIIGPKNLVLCDYS